jgi:hypothetical protein
VNAAQARAIASGQVRGQKKVAKEAAAARAAHAAEEAGIAALAAQAAQATQAAQPKKKKVTKVSLPPPSLKETVFRTPPRAPHAPLRVPPVPTEEGGSVL